MELTHTYSPQELAQYQLQGSVPDFAAEMRAYQQASQQASISLRHDKSTHQYGPNSWQQLDVFAARKPDAPVYFFIHGGYWRMLNKESSAMMAENLHAAGATVVCIDYGLAPDFTLQEIVNQCDQALSWIYQHAHEFNADAKRIHISGSSAGGHLCGMLLAYDAHRPKPTRRIQSASLMSGLMDLYPIQQSHVNEWLHLDESTAYALSPLYHLPASQVPILVAWGESEPWVMHAQSLQYIESCLKAGKDVEALQVKQCNHFNILMELTQPSSLLSKKITELVFLNG